MAAGLAEAKKNNWPVAVAVVDTAGMLVAFEKADGTQNGGATGAVVLAESHLAIHTWPESGGATLDVYVCNFTADNTSKAESVYKALVKALKPADVLVERVMRGRDLPLKKRVA